MKLGEEHPDLDDIDRQILTLMQENCRLPLAKIGERVGLSAPSVLERVKKLEDGGIITAYRAVVDARRLGKDITAFIGVSTGHPHAIDRFEREIESLDDVLECHHVTGIHTMILKAKTRNTSSLEELISRIRAIEGVVRTETMVVLSTHTERSQIPVVEPTPAPRRSRRSPEKALHLKGVH
ncbi:MAG: Lrp/AsnC family transcriptional regulator [Deltaproteobacteria bacterium]|nr:Lrp/AsnC family transcriptional regulator [Deltaproteobacteria bacterium]